MRTEPSLVTRFARIAAVLFGGLIFLALAPIQGAVSVGLKPSTAAVLNATFTYTAEGDCYNGSAQASFHSRVVGGTPTYNYSWNFGDGSPLAFIANPSHQYAHTFGGPYNATLKVKDSTGMTAAETQRIVFALPPCAPPPTQPIAYPIEILGLVIFVAIVGPVAFVWVRRARRR